MKPAGLPTSTALLAAALSFVVPGFGQLLVRSWLRGGIWLAGWLLVSASGEPHSPVVLALSIIAAIDAYAITRSQQPAGPRVGPGRREGEPR